MARRFTAGLVSILFAATGAQAQPQTQLIADFYRGKTVNILIGVGVVLGTLSPFMIVPLFIYLIRKRLILPEEAMLDKSCGFAYAEYKRRIRRWL